MNKKDRKQLIWTLQQITHFLEGYYDKKTKDIVLKAWFNNGLDDSKIVLNLSDNTMVLHTDSNSLYKSISDISITNITKHDPVFKAAAQHAANKLGHNITLSNADKTETPFVADHTKLYKW